MSDSSMPVRTPEDEQPPTYGGGSAARLLAGRGSDGSGAGRTRVALWLGFVILLLALNMRAAVVALAPVFDTVLADTGMSAFAGGVLAAVPVLCFGVFAFPAPRLARRLGLEQTLLLASVVLTAGIVLRLATPIPALFAGTAMLGVAIAVCNVLVPALVKARFPSHVGLMTGLYVTSMSVGGTIAAGATVPMMDATGLGWRAALALWAIPAVAAAALWLPYAFRRRRHQSATAPVPAGRGVYRDRLAWQVAAYMGFQGLGYYSCTAWLPSVLISEGISTEAAGAQLALCNLVGIPFSLVVPMLAARAPTQRGYVVAGAVTCAAGLLGMTISPAAAPALWMILIGIGQGASIGLALTFFGLRASDGRQAAELSGMAQTVGYLFAASGPSLVGALHDVSGGWTLALAFLTAALLPQLLAGLGAARDLKVGAASSPAAGPAG